MIKRWIGRTESSHHVIEALRGLVSVRFVVGRHWLRYVASCNASDVTPFARLVAKAAVGSTVLQESMAHVVWGLCPSKK